MDTAVNDLCRVLAKANGLDWDEVCAFEAHEGDDGSMPDFCESGTCVAAFYEDHEPEIARAAYRRQAGAVIAYFAMLAKYTEPADDVSVPAGLVEAHS